MRFIRLAALVGSLVLLVATAVSIVNRRSDLRDEQTAQVAQSSLLVTESVRTSITRVRQAVHLAAIAASDPAVDNQALAAELVRFFPDSEACSGDPSGCTGADLFSLSEVDDLATRSVQVDWEVEGVAALSQVAVDDSSESLLVVSEVLTDSGTGRVALRVPVESLVSPRTLATVERTDATIDVATRTQDSIDVVNLPQNDGDRRSMSETIGSPFASGSVDVTIESIVTVGIAGEATARYATLLALGTVLLALAGWTFLVERRQLERRATTDELTDLINRREFERVSEDALDMADRFNTGLCVMVIDLNGFKQVNDTLGHQFGDLVLAASAERLVDAVRDTDVVGRWGGDEFVILLPGLAERTAVRNSAERIWHRLAGTPVVGDTTMSASIGAAIFPRHGTTLDALMRAADVAMYEAKTTGVSHRIADTIAVNDSLFAETQTGARGEPRSVDRDWDSEGLPGPVFSDSYVGADRRRSPVPPPPQPSAEFLPPPEAVHTPTSADS
jgi:diguanylate cyclase (GGDEF)-like protein